MSCVRAHFVRGAGIGSAAISWFSAGPFSHVDAVLPDGRLLGARSDAIGGQPPGVRIRPWGYERWSRETLIELACTAEQAAAFHRFLRAQVGKPYDKLAILGFAIARDWREEDAWYCSELVTRALEVAGICRPLYMPASKITPVTCAVVMSALGGIARGLGRSAASGAAGT